MPSTIVDVLTSPKCDCSNQEDALNNCGGSCEEDADADGICDNADDCVGDYNSCGICNGDEALYDVPTETAMASRRNRRLRGNMTIVECATAWTFVNSMTLTLLVAH